MRLLFLADVFADAGVRAVERELPLLRAELELDVVIANGENAADGVGITAALARRLFGAGVDAITLGNHTWRKKGIGAYLQQEPRLIRPANMLESLPGRGIVVVEGRNGVKVAVLNLMGMLTLSPDRNAFSTVDGLVAEALRSTPVVLLDMHAEATSEKVAMGWHLAGKVTAVIGTHTHVQTNDARVLPGGTAYLTDAGMTGPHDSVIGVKKEIILRRFLTQLPQRSEPAGGDVRLEGCIIECGEDGRATGIELFRRVVG